MIRIVLPILILSCASHAFADNATPSVDADGTIETVGGKIPFSTGASKEALKRFQEILVEDKSAPGLLDPLASRTFYDKINTDRAERMKKLYPVEIAHSTIGGVSVDIVKAAGAKSDDARVLINLHGGAFLWGAGSGGLVEAIPVASLAKIKVITIDYRQGPESTFPAASEDVEKVYRALLAHHQSANIGIYGCSAGGVLTGEAIAWLADKKLPMPGAIGIFCAGIGENSGDSTYIGPLLMGQALPPGPFTFSMLPYFKGADQNSALVVPARSHSLLAKFPPTLLISGTRDFELSAVLRSDELLTEAGAPTELHVWEGMWHSFFSDPELPESQAAYHVMANFFQRRLGATRKP